MDWTPSMPHCWSKLSMTPQGSIHPFVSERGTIEIKTYCILLFRLPKHYFVISSYYIKSLKTPTEAVNRRTDNKMSKEKRMKTMVHNTQHRKQSIE